MACCARYVARFILTDVNGQVRTKSRMSTRARKHTRLWPVRCSNVCVLQAESCLTPAPGTSAQTSTTPCGPRTCSLASINACKPTTPRRLGTGRPGSTTSMPCLKCLPANDNYEDAPVIALAFRIPLGFRDPTIG